MSHRGRTLAWLLLAFTGCGRLSDEKALEVVKAYDAALVEAYRTGDPRPLEGWAGPAEKKKVAALIGVKLDAGINLDARLVALKLVSVVRQAEGIEVTTEERWYYLDRRIGTGEQVGQDSHDRYSIRYHLGEVGGRWLVTAVEFATPPEVGRKETLGGDVRVLHGIQTLDPAQERIDPGPRPGAGEKEQAR
jgi:hypothetical protein